MPATTPATVATEKTDGDTPASTATSLPDQLLALLGGTWAMAAPAEANAAPAPQAAAPSPTPSAAPVAGGGKAGNATPALLPTIASAATNAIASQPDASGAAIVIDSSAKAASSGDTVAAAAPDTNAAFPVFPNIAPSAASATETRAAAAAAATPLTVPADPQTGFDDGFGARLVWMAEQRLGHAEIRLNPEHLGPIDVRVQVDGTQVNAEFHSAHAAVRQTIEASMPRLRELLGQQGLQLNQADVGQRHAGSGQPPRASADSAPASDAPMSSDAAAIRPLRSRGLLDEYA